MFAFGRYKDERTEHEKALEWELDEYHLREERRGRDERRKQEEREREMKEEHEYYWREADNWPDALQKQIYLCRREVGNIGDDTPPEEDFFEQTAQACEEALKIWKTAEEINQPRIDELEAQIQALKDKVRMFVADRLDEISQNSGYSNTAQQIRNDDLGNFLNW